MSSSTPSSSTPPSATPQSGAPSTAGSGAEAASVVDAHLPFRHDGGPVGVLLCHGFTSSPVSMRPWADDLAAAGHTVRLPLLPGHGTTWQDMNRTTFEDWFGCVRSELAELITRCETVFVAGLSMGGTLSLRLAETHPDAIAGLILVNPSVLTLRKDLAFLPVLKHLVPALNGIAEDIAKPGQQEKAYTKTPLKALDSLRRTWPVVRKDLDKVTMPVLLMRSAVDHVVEPENARAVLDGVSSSDVTEIVLERSYHVATLDYDADEIFRASRSFIDRVTAVTV
ncbi:alpha/beta fold hydrolase [Nakamurella silvestris]|nr:alpha/beta fold hydrolase [Nakamurella silvestris]